MLSAMTTNSKSVTIDYRVDQALVPGPSSVFQFGIYRSSNSQFDINASLVSTWTASAQGQAGLPLDDNGQPTAAVGTHQLTIPLPAGLPPYPLKPYVLVVADPQQVQPARTRSRPRRSGPTRSASSPMGGSSTQAGNMALPGSFRRP